MMKKLLFTVICFTLWVPMVSARDIYIAQNASGAASGSDCADALAWSAFGSSANWVAGNTLHICGTYNVPVNGTGITVLGNGASGNPITIFFEPGAVITSAAMSLGININNHSYITVNGGPLISGALNGTIQNTANGYGLANQVSSPECVYNSGSNVTVEYINCHNLYVTTPADNSGNDQALGIAVGNNGIITHCSFDHGDLGLAGANASNVEISYNTVNYTNHEITVGTSGGTASNIKIHDNDLLGGGYVYDGNGGAYHRDGIIVICEGSTNPCVTGLWIYNNRFTGAMTKATNAGTTSLFLHGRLFDQPDSIGGVQQRRRSRFRRHRSEQRLHQQRIPRTNLQQYDSPADRLRRLLPRTASKQPTEHRGKQYYGCSADLETTRMAAGQAVGL